MAPTLEVAFDILDATLQEKNLKIVGVYEAILVIKKEVEASPLTQFIAETIRNNHF